MGEVELNINSYDKCLCPVCPVERKSACVDSKKEQWKQMRKKVGEILEEYPDHPETYEMSMSELENNEIGKKHGFHKPHPADMIELFCAREVGGSSCDDLDDNKNCQCPTCTVWLSYSLSSKYYCLTSRA